MRSILTIIFTVLLLNITYSSENEEFRSVWVITWEHIRESRSVEENKAQVRKILDNLKSANMNAVLWHARQSGTAYYNSSYEPWGYYAGNTDPGYDPLAYAIEEAHKRGIELHAWFNVFHASSMEPGTPAYEHPEWVCTNIDDQYMTSYRCLSPGIQEVREYTLDVAMEIVNNYDIDGLHLDFIRWNEYDEDDMNNAHDMIEQISVLDGLIPEQKLNKITSTSGTKRYIYDAQHPASGGVPEGFANWDDWRRWGVTEFVRTLHDSIQAVKPWVRLSPAALGNYMAGGTTGWNGYFVVFQDAALWFNEGYVDQLAPMHYHWLTGSSMKSAFQADWEPNIEEGINAGRLYSAGPASYRLADNNVWSNHKGIVESCRTLDWVNGFQFFSYGEWSNFNYWDEAANSFFKHITKVRAAKFMADLTPDVPTFSMNKIDSLNYDLTVQPSSIDTDHWFAIYRSTNDTLDVDVDEIIDIHFGDGPYSFNDVFDGNQDYNGTYNYYATMLDRYWNESMPSSSEVSDLIPSFAPQVVETSLSQGDTILVNTDIQVNFSKTMDQDNFQDNLTIAPEVSIQSLTWTENDHLLTIKFGSSLSYATSYVFTIKKEVNDINGKALNGDPDSPGSEDFVLSFRTVDRDIIGPQIVFANPEMNNSIMNFDVDGIVSVAFDELIDEESVDENTSFLLSQGQLVNSKMLMNTVNNRSVLSIQSEDPFLPLVDYSVFLSKNITDTAGNPMGSTVELELQTAPYEYSETIIIDALRSAGTGDWKDPEWSGSTVGTVGKNTTFSYTKDFYLPTVAKPIDKASAKLEYEWNTESTEFLLREVLWGGSAQGVTFDTTYNLQCYVYGDGSHNYFRFCLREVEPVDTSQTPLEVSSWQIIDWIGWKLLEWDLGDPMSIGSWLGNEIMDGKEYYFDSFQLKHEQGGSIKSRIYLKNLRLIKKTYATNLENMSTMILNDYKLSQNFPNPFNPSTKISFSIPNAGFTTLTVYDILGRKVQKLVSENLMPGSYTYKFDGSGLASGTYFYILKSENVALKNKMLLIK